MVGKGEELIADVAGDVDFAGTVGDNVGVQQTIPQHPDVFAFVHLGRIRRQPGHLRNQGIVFFSVPFSIHRELEILQAMVLRQVGGKGTQRPRRGRGIGEDVG